MEPIDVRTLWSQAATSHSIRSKHVLTLQFNGWTNGVGGFDKFWKNTSHSVADRSASAARPTTSFRAATAFKMEIQWKVAHLETSPDTATRLLAYLTLKVAT